MKITIAHIIFLLIVFQLKLNAEVKLSSIFSDNMLLQRDISIPLRGAADNEKKVKVLFNGKEYSSKVKDGKWLVNLPATPAGGHYTIDIKGENNITLKNITFGDIWVCAGQSNMDSHIYNYKKNYPELYKGHPIKEDSRIRIFKVEVTTADNPLNDVVREKTFANGWQTLGEHSLSSFTATGYFFGLHLIENVDVPIGLIQSCRGGTPITTWLPDDVLESREMYKPFVDDYKKAVENWPKAKKDYDNKMEEWRSNYNPENKGFWEQTPEARRNLPPMPNGLGNPKRPSAYHNGMIAPLYQLPVKGVLWYQGEGSSNNEQRIKMYEQNLQDLITSWRTNWDNEEMPFIIVQLPSFHKYRETPRATDGWPLTREAQKNAEKLSNCKTICILDAGLEDDIHPPYKEKVGKRLAYAARTMVYKQEGVPQSPEYISHISKGDSTIITFKNVGLGLYTKQPQLDKGVYNEGDITGFIVSNKEGDYIRVKGRILAPNKVIIKHPEIFNPTSIRYAWENFPNCNLFGEGDMPAFPFTIEQNK